MCVVLRFCFKIIEEDTEHYLSLNVQLIVDIIYDKGNSRCQICQFCVVGYSRKTLDVVQMKGEV